MSQVSSHYFKRGMWVDQQDGPVLGRIITTDSRTGTLIVALLAMVTAFGTAHLWNLVIFAHHQLRSKGRPDGLFRQQQALLRTLPTPTAFISEWVKLWWSWRRRAEKPLMRSFPQFVLGIAFSIATIAVSLSVSYIVSTGNVRVLLAGSPSCAPMNWTILEQGRIPSDLLDYCVHVTKGTRDYAENCYSEIDQIATTDVCKTFITPRIDLQKSRVPCPFKQTMCAKMDLPGLALDSGLVDLNDGLGLNLPKHQRVKLRKRTTCAILDLEGRTRIVNGTDGSDKGEQSPLDHQYVELTGLGQFQLAGQNITFSSPIPKPDRKYSFKISPYMKHGDPFYAKWNDLIPHPDMSNNNVDLVIIIIGNAIDYKAPVDDPLFSAHVPVEIQGGQIIYRSDFPLSALGCETQYQLCHARSSQEDFCTSLSPLPAPVTSATLPTASEVQLAALRLLQSGGALFDTESSATSLKAGLFAGDYGFLTTLPNDQWIQELEAWEARTWISLQLLLRDYAIGFSTRRPTSNTFQDLNLTSADRQLCHLQRMRSSGGLVNISVFGLAFTLTLSGLIIVLDIVLLKFLIFFKRFRKTLAPRVYAWIQDGVYQWQRQAYEAYGKGKWESLDEEIPLTELNAELPGLPLRVFPDASPASSVEQACKC